MSTIKPFRAVRPAAELVERVAALPYDVVSSREARAIVQNNPESFLAIDRPETLFEDPNKNPYDSDCYEAARDKLRAWIKDWTLIQDKEPALYIYQLTMEGRVQNGLVCCTSVDEYLNGTIKRHELTLAQKEVDRTVHIDTVGAHTGPIFLMYPGEEKIEKIKHDWMASHETYYDFGSEDGTVAQKVWKIDDKNTIDELVAAFGEVPALYIADGHHRNASAKNVALKRREENPGYTGEEEFNYYLSVIFPKNELKIYDYNRVVRDLNGLTAEQFMEKLSELFEITELKGAVKPEKPHTFSMYLGRKWYRLECREGVIDENADVTEKLDVSVLQNKVLGPILDINDPTKNPRIGFVGGIKGIEFLANIINSVGNGAAFAMYPTSIDDLQQVADENKIMPPKSTWFEPKLRSGLFIHMLDD